MRSDHLIEWVNQYRTNYGSRLREQITFYSRLESLEMAIDYAALAKRSDGKKHPHQRRLQNENLLAVKHNLLENRGQLSTSTSFADIIQLVRACAVAGFGPLGIYDTALRLAAYLDHLPDYVYLHAGTSTGAAKLGLQVNREYLAITELPEAIQVLEPYQAEDFLCIYKEHLTRPEQPSTAMPKNCNPQTPPPVTEVTDCNAVSTSTDTIDSPKKC